MHNDVFMLLLLLPEGLFTIYFPWKKCADWCFPKIHTLYRSRGESRM